MKKIIFLVDMNSFYVTCELLRQPQYKKQALIISGKGKRSVISAASYVAKAQGIDSAMSLRNALKINPDVVILEPDFSYYHQQSKRIMTFLRQFGQQLLQASVDEAYLDVSHYFAQQQPTYNNILKLATFIQAKLLKELGFPCNIGISSNKFLAKMASELDKPFKVASIFIPEIEDKLWPQPIAKMFGIGKKTAQILQHIHIKTIGDFATFENEQLLKNLFGPSILERQQYARGIIDETKEGALEREARKSISHSETFMTDQVEEKIIFDKLAALWQDVVADLQKKQLKIRGLRVFYKQSDFHTVQRSVTFEDYWSDWAEIFKIARELLNSLWEDEPIRLIGIGVFDFIAASQHAEQMNIFQLEWEHVPEHIQAKRKQAALQFVEAQVGMDQVKTAKMLLEEQKKRKDKE